MIFRISHSLVAINQMTLTFNTSGVLLEGTNRDTESLTAACLPFKESFFPSTIWLWNALSDNIIAADSLETFRTRIQEYKPMQPLTIQF
jgi:hypothetical protein